jgi:hypothetical protein
MSILLMKLFYRFPADNLIDISHERDDYHVSND